MRCEYRDVFPIAPERCYTHQLLYRATLRKTNSIRRCCRQSYTSDRTRLRLVICSLSKLRALFYRALSIYSPLQTRSKLSIRRSCCDTFRFSVSSPNNDRASRCKNQNRKTAPAV